MKVNCEGQNEGNNGGIMMYNYGLDHREIYEQFLVFIWPTDIIGSREKW